MPGEAVVDVAEGREVGRAVPRDRGRAGDPGKAGFRVDARSALEVFRVGAVDHDVARADLGDHDAPHGAAVAGVTFELAGEEGYSRPLIGNARQRTTLDGCRRGVFDLAQLAAQMVLPEQRVEGRDRLLPDERDKRIEQRERADDDHQHGQHVHRARRRRAALPCRCERRAWRCCDKGLWHCSYRRRADSVPPSDPGPAYDSGPRIVTSNGAASCALQSRPHGRERNDRGGGGTAEREAPQNRPAEPHLPRGHEQHGGPRDIAWAQPELVRVERDQRGERHEAQRDERNRGQTTGELADVQAAALRPEAATRAAPAPPAAPSGDRRTTPAGRPVAAQRQGQRRRVGVWAQAPSPACASGQSTTATSARTSAPPPPPRVATRPPNGSALGRTGAAGVAPSTRANRAHRRARRS